MANKVLSIDMGYSLTKVCEMDYGVKNPKIYNHFVIPTPQGMMNDGMITIDDKFVTSFQKLLTENKMKTRKAVFSIASSRIATREVKIPYCKPNRIIDVVRANIEEYFPVDTSQYMISHSILGTEDSASKNDPNQTNQLASGRPTGYKLLLLAAPKQMLNSYQELAKAIGLTVVTVDYNGNSIYQAAKDTLNDGTQMVIKVDERASLLMVIKAGVIVLNRTIPYGVDDAIDVLMETKTLGNVSSYTEAMRLAASKQCLLENTVMHSELSAEEIDESEEEKRHVTEALNSLLGGIARVIDYYNSNHSQEQIEKIYLTGSGADVKGFSKLLTKEIGFPIHVLEQLGGVSADKVFTDGGFGEYVTCIGAALAPLSFYSDKAPEGKTSGKLKMDYGKAALLFFIVCVGISMVLMIVSVVPYFMENQKRKSYEQIITDLTPAYDTYVTYEQLNNELAQIQTLDYLTKNQNEGLVKLIEALEQNMPTSFRLNSLSATTEGVTLAVTVSTKEESAAVLEELRKLDSFTQTDTTSITEVTTEIGEKQYTFTVDMVYAPVTEQTQETEAAK